jgi:hypothetical protein
VEGRRGRRLPALAAAGALAALVVPALSGAQVANPTIPAKHDTEPVVLTGAQLSDPTWVAPSNFTGKLPLIDLTECQSFDEQCEHNHYADPELDTEATLGQGTPIDRLVGYRWDDSPKKWKQIPFQVDEQFARYLNNSASGFSVYSGEDEHTTYAYDREGDREGFRYTQSDPYDPSNPDAICNAKPASPPAYDPVKGLDANDELAFMASDAGPQAPADAALPAGIEGAKQVVVTDPTNPSAAPTYVYVMKAAANGPKPAFDADNGYVSYKRDPGAGIFAFSQSSYDGYGNAAAGPYCDDNGHVVRNPDGSLRTGRRRPRDGATITTDRYKYRYDGRWLMTKIQISPDGGDTFGPDLVDRWKARAFAQDAASETPCCGYEEEDTNWGGSSTLLGEHVGPVRAVRETWGADSGTNVIRRETFYREEMRQLTFLRVHVIPPLDGIYAQWDFNAEKVKRFYNPTIASNPAQFPLGYAPIDGKNDEVFGNFDDPCNRNWDGNDTGLLAQTYRAAYKDAQVCDFSEYHQSVDIFDPTFTPTNAGLAWSQVAGPNGTIVDRITTNLERVTPGGAAQSAVAVPYYRDDACFDDGTGTDPGPKVKKRSGDEPTTYGSPPADRECWDGTPQTGDGDPGSTDEAPNARFFQGSIGTHGVHLLFLLESDNARLTKPVDEIVSDWRMVFLPGDRDGTTGEQYGRGFEKPLVPLITGFAGGGNQYGNGGDGSGQGGTGGGQGGTGGGQGGTGGGGGSTGGGQGAGGGAPSQLLPGILGQGNSSRCAPPEGAIKGKTLGRARLGRTRSAERRAFPSFSRRRAGVDRFCIRGGGHIRIGYMTKRTLGKFARRRRRGDRAVLILTTSRHYAIRGVRHGSRVRTLRKRFRRARSFRIGRNRWYVAPGRRTRLVFKTHRRRVEEIGIAERRPTRTRRRAKRFLRNFPG